MVNIKLATERRPTRPTSPFFSSPPGFLLGVGIPVNLNSHQIHEAQREISVTSNPQRPLRADGSRVRHTDGRKISSGMFTSTKSLLFRYDDLI